MRQLHDAASVVPHRGYVAHFRAREQPLILRVIAGHGMKQVHVFDRRQPFNLEIAKPPEMQPFPHHGVDPAVELLLFIRILAAGAIGEMHAGYTMAVTGAGGGRYDAPDGAREASLVEYRAHFLLRSLGVTQLAGMENVKIDDD